MVRIPVDLVGWSPTRDIGKQRWTEVVAVPRACNAEPSALSAIKRPDAPSVEVTRHLLQYLLSGHFAPGDRIPSERKLAEVLEIGRASVREAIKSLSLLGLVVVRQGDGTYLTQSTSNLLPEVIEWGLLLGERHIEDLIEARTNLEAFNASLAAERGSDDQIKELWKRLEAMRSAGTDYPAYVQADIDFHSHVARMSGNEVLANLASSFQSLLRVWAAKVIKAHGDTMARANEHEPIAAAIAARDADAARREMDFHMREAARRLREAIVAETGRS
jgi:GntR family transcriptional repressor for pyruvate dehydrogenase complex